MMEIDEAIEMVGRLEIYRQKQEDKTRKLQHAAHLARQGNTEEARRIKANVDRQPHVFGGDVLPAMQAMKAKIAELEGEVERLEWENKGIAEWRSMFNQLAKQHKKLRKTAKKVVDAYAHYSSWQIDALAKRLEEEKK